MNMRVTHLITVSALVCCFSGMARAEGPDEAGKQEARELMARGREARDKADLRMALDDFQKADAIMHVPTTGLEVARTLVAQGKLLEAADEARRVSDLDEAPDEPEAFGKARRSAKDLVGELETRIPTLNINLNVPVDSVSLSLDGKPLSAGSETARVNPGRHFLLAERGGTKRVRNVNAVEGATLNVSFSFGESEPPALGSNPSAAHARTTSTVVYVLAGTAVLGVGSGIGLGLWGNHQRSHLESTCAPRCSPNQVAVLKDNYLAANVAAAVGAAAGVGAIALYWAQSNGTPKRRAQSSLALVANAGGTSGVSLAGTF